VKVTVTMVTYRRAWALPHSLASIANQTRKPDEVLVVLRSSGDGIEEVIEKFSSQLLIRLILQKEGNCAYAYQLAIDDASGDLILFIDDDAVVEMQWVEKYVQLFDTLPKAGGVTGRTFKAYLKDGDVVKTQKEFYEDAADVLPETSSGIFGLHRLGF